MFHFRPTMNVYKNYYFYFDIADVLNVAALLCKSEAGRLNGVSENNGLRIQLSKPST